MKNKFLLAMVLIFSIQAAASEATGIFGYDYWVPIWISEYFEKLATPSAFELAQQQNPQSQAGFDPQKCTPVFAKAFAKNKLDIRYALGYFDVSDGEDVVWENRHFGISASLDIDIYEAINLSLIEQCKGPKQLCGFTVIKEASTLGKTIYTKKTNILGHELEVMFTLTHASASNNFEKNKNELKDLQAQLTKQSEEVFFGGLAEADIVFYNGHSRNGGGPDFNPPILNSEMHPDYDGYYRVKKPGITRALAQMIKNPNQGFVYGSFSCFSYSHFYDMIMKADPKIRLVLSADKINYRDSLEASMGYLEGFLQGRCSEDLAQFAKRDQHLYDGFKGFQIR